MPKEILTAYDAPWKIELKALIDKARKEGLWLHCNYQDLWFSPDDLEKENARGSFLWGTTNWTLRDPKQYLAEADARVKQALMARGNIARMIMTDKKSQITQGTNRSLWGQCPTCNRGIRIRNGKFYCPNCKQELGDAV